MQIITKNPSALKRRAWVDIPVPLQPPDHLRWRLPDKNWPVLRGIDIGSHTTLLHMMGEWDGNETISGDLERLTDFQPLPFQPSEWVGDEPKALIPNFLLKRHNEKPQNVPLVGLTIDPVEDGEARQVFHMNGRIKDTMLVMDAWTYIYSASDAVRMEILVTNSDPSTTRLDETFEHIGVRTGEFFSLDHREHYGIDWPGRKTTANWGWHQRLAYDRTIADGQQMMFSGWLTCLPTPETVFLDHNDPATQFRIQSLRAYYTIGNINLRGGPVWGMGDFSGDGDWLGFGATPQLPQLAGTGVAAFHHRIYESKADWYDGKPKGLAKSAGQTGSQQDFGACKAGACIHWQEPLLIEELLYMTSEHYRPCHNRQPNGQPISKESNPKLWTWSQLPIGTTDPGPADDLGKGFDSSGVWPPRRQGTGYSGIDDQHRSQNTFNAAYALTGSHALRSILNDLFQIDRCQVPNRIGAPRAIGRLFSTWASMLRLLPGGDVTTLEDHMWERMKVIEKDWKGKNVPEDRPIRVLTLGSDPDLRNPDGSRKVAWIVWEHAIATMGFYAASLQTDGIKSDAYKQSAKHFAELVTQFGCFYDGVNWRCCTAVEYLQGAAEGNPVQYGNDSKSIRIFDSFWTWTLPAIIIAGRLTDDPAIRERSDAIQDQVRGVRPRDWDTSEWYAV